MGSLLVCGKCKDNQSDWTGSKIDIQKVILSGYANVLCRKCRIGLEVEVADIARKYLCPKERGEKK